MEETAEAAGQFRSRGMKSKMPVRALACRCSKSSSLPSAICLPCSGSITLLFISSSLLCVADPPSVKSVYRSFHAKGARASQFTGAESLAGRCCCAAQAIWAERQLCPARKLKIFVMHPMKAVACIRNLQNLADKLRPFVTHPAGGPSHLCYHF